jgi:hypothetical protein
MTISRLFRYPTLKLKSYHAGDNLDSVPAVVEEQVRLFVEVAQIYSEYWPFDIVVYVRVHVEMALVEIQYAIGRLGFACDDESVHGLALFATSDVHCAVDESDPC